MLQDEEEKEKERKREREISLETSVLHPANRDDLEEVRRRERMLWILLRQAHGNDIMEGNVVEAR